MSKCLLAFLFLAVFTAAAEEEHHRAKHLGNLSTRFAPTIFTVDDLRSRFRDEKLKADMGEILTQWGWQGDLQDLFQAAVTNEVSDIKIPVGATMPFMSSREAGHPVCLRNVLWAGKEPISAYAFNFSSKGRRYRCVTPKPCSNFFVEDLGPEPKAVIALDCATPEKFPVNRFFEVCLTLRNTGDLAEPKTTVTLPLPQTVTVTDITAGGVSGGGQVTWQVADLASQTSTQLCCMVSGKTVGPAPFVSTATGSLAGKVNSACETKVFGIPAILLEKSDDPDPVDIGSNTVYTVKITNQGSAEDTNVRVVVDVAPELVPVDSATGVISGQTVVFPVVPTLAPKEAVTYTVTAKGFKAGDGHTKFTLTSDMLHSPITAEESTQVY
jgi:hypothetical protein